MSLRESIRGAYESRLWYWRLLLLPWLIMMGLGHLKSSEYTSPFEWLNVVIHEVGHPLFGVFGQFMGVAGGTLLQLIVPVVALVILLRQSEYFAIPLCGVWLADNLYGVSRYIADTRVQDRDYVTLGVNTGQPVEATHDWEYLLEHFNALNLDTTIASWVRTAAVLLTWGSIAAGFWMAWVIATRPRRG